MPSASTRPKYPIARLTEGAVMWGITLDATIRTAQKLAGDLLNNRPAAASFTLLDEESDDGIQVVEFEFNGVTIRTFPGSDTFGLVRDFRRAISGRFDGIVGPRPAHNLTSAELFAEYEAAVKRETDERRWKEESDRERAAKVADLAPFLDGNPIQLLDESAWAEIVETNSKDGYSRGVVEFAERWAQLMQYDLAEGRSLADIARPRCSDADLDGITGFMYGAAVGILAQVWVYGDDLRRWHNVDTQIGDEGERANEAGGTLNPALLSIGVES